MKEIQAREIMSTAVHSVSPGLSLVDLEHEFASHRISGAPVVERGSVIGIVSRADIERTVSRERSKSAAVASYYYGTDPVSDESPGLPADPTAAALESLRTLTVRSVMTSEVISVARGHSIVAVAELMRSKRIHRVLVIEDGKLLGIVTSLDIVGAVAGLA